MSETYLIGPFSAHHRGFGFVQSDEEDFEVFIPKRFVDDAIDGDTVKVCYDPSLKTAKGYEGKIVEVVERKRKYIYAIIADEYSKNIYIGHAPILGSERPLLIKKAPKKLKIGDQILVTINKWKGKENAVDAIFSEKIGNIEDPLNDLKATIYEHMLLSTFPKACEEQALSFGTKVEKKDEEGRKDLTKLECFTIDPKDAKDFDDALSLSKKGKQYHLHVHIADVSHYIKPGSILDKEAYLRGNSTYLPGKCLPMIPENLSNHLCSLKPNVKRLAATVEMTFNEQGDLLSHQIYKSVIKSQKRFTYEEAKEVLDGKKSSPYLKSLELMVELCLLLKKKRKERGSIDFSLPEVKIVVDENGRPTGFTTIEYDITHQLVEEFMLKANEMVATHLIKEGKKTIFRVHEHPADDKLETLYQFIRILGYPLSKEPTVEEIQKIFEMAKATPHFHHLSVNFIKSMKLAYYSDENVGHYGLSLENYLHFTSPIRRYSDLIAHRAVFHEEVGDLTKIAKHISTKERQSFKAESSTIHMKKLRLLDEYLEKKPHHLYEATITKCKPHGIFFDLSTFFMEGFIHISQLGNDYYIFDPVREDIEGEYTHVQFRPGQKIHVELESLDLVYRECEWSLAKKR